MKRITVGRGNDCDIVIVDETDNISRHHLVITFNILGKMKVSDTSSNGTFINGTRMLKGTSIPVTTEDKIRLGRNIDLDWNLVKDPYRPTRIITIFLLSAFIIAALCIYGWLWYKEKSHQTDNSRIELISTDIKADDNWNKDSTAKVAPTVTSIEVRNKKSSSSQNVNRKKKNVKKVSKQKETTHPEKKNNSELDSIAVF